VSKTTNAPDTVALARAIRRHALTMTHRAKASHIGSCLSMADLLAVLYGAIGNINPDNRRDPDRDRIIVSKGHGAAVVYAVLAESGFFPAEMLGGYSQDASLLTGHVSHKVPGVEISTGSLGHGLPIACGMALAGKRAQRSYRTFAILSDGELNEGSNWEALLFAGHHKLGNLVCMIDFNRIQSFGSVAEVLDLGDLPGKFRSVKWNVKEIDGHDHAQITSALKDAPGNDAPPTAVIAHTTKGKGVSFMENKLEWHYKSADASELERALAEVGPA
jgi:transketolase